MESVRDENCCLQDGLCYRRTAQSLCRDLLGLKKHFPVQKSTEAREKHQLVLLKLALE